MIAFDCLLIVSDSMLTMGSRGPQRINHTKAGTKLIHDLAIKPLTRLTTKDQKICTLFFDRVHVDIFLFYFGISVLSKYNISLT